MNNIDVKIHYLYHSSFAVETKNNFLIFDYFNDKPQDNIHDISKGVITKKELLNHKNIFVFASHSHSDHFNPLIFNWENINQNIEYILSDDIPLKKEKGNIHSLPSYKNLSLKDIEIKSYGSTDIGISFLIKVDGINIFHSGDLNWWHWKDESLEEQKNAEIKFKDEIEKLSNENIEIAFFPVDPRLEEFYHIGGEYFARKVKPKLLIPMHFANNPSITEDFYNIALSIPVNSVKINQRGQEILFSKR